MIRWISNRDIDRARWDTMVVKHGRGRIYALSAYLDATCQRWEALLLGDYEAIMPIPLKRYWIGRTRFDMPLFVQQLGILGLDDSNDEMRDQFIRKVSVVYPHFIHSFNHENGSIKIEGFKSTDRTNYELDLNRSYEDLKKHYSENLKRNLKKAGELEFRTDTPFQDLGRFINQYSSTGDPTPKHIATIKKITEIEHAGFSPDIYSVWRTKELLAVCLAPATDSRITLLIPRSSDDGRSTGAMAYLIDSIIRRYAGSKMTLDFEGSMLPGVAKFYRGFGAKDRVYKVVTK